MYKIPFLSPFKIKNKLVILIILLFSVSANAANNSQTGVSARALSLGNAVTAYPPGIMSIHYNPAGLSKLKGKAATLGVTYPVTRIDSSFLDDNEFSYLNENDPINGSNCTSDGGAMYLPFYGSTSEFIMTNAGIYKHKSGSRFSFAFGIYSPYATGFSYDSDEPARYGGIMAYNQRVIYASPAISYKVNDVFSIGLSVGFGQGAEGFKMAFRSPDPGYSAASSMMEIINFLFDFIKKPELNFKNFSDELKEIYSILENSQPVYDPLCNINMDNLKDNFTTSFNIGMLWEPVDWFSAGICYQSKSKGRLAGDYHIDYTDAFNAILEKFNSPPASDLLGFVNEFQEKEDGRVSVDWTWPQSAQFGIMLNPFKKLRLMCDLRWEDWSVIKRETFKFDQNIQLLQMALALGYQKGLDKLVFERHWKDTWNLSYGLEYEINSSFILRFGYEDKKSYVPDEYFDLRWPVEDCKIYSCGVGIGLSDKMSMDLAFSFMDGEGVKIKSNNNFIYSPYAGLKYKQNTDSYIFSMDINYVW